MTIHRRTLLTSSLALAVAGPLSPSARARAASHLLAYDSEAQMREALERWHQRSQQLRQDGVRRRAESAAVQDSAALNSLSMGAAKSMAAPAAAPPAVAEAAGAESITNVQTAGVDEGGIVKRAGDSLVDPAPRPAVHRARGRRRPAAGRRCRRLRAGQPTRRAPGTTNCWSSGRDGGGDRLQLCARRHRDRPVRARRATAACATAPPPPAQLRLLLVAQLREPADRPQAGLLHARRCCRPGARSRGQQFPAVRRWQGEADAPAQFERILPATRVYRTDDDFDPGAAAGAAHRDQLRPAAAPTCAANRPPCSGRPGACSTSRKARSTCGPAPARRPVPQRPAPRAASLSAVFRLPLDGTRAERAEDRRRADRPDVVPRGRRRPPERAAARDRARGEGMWGSERTHGAMALLRVPLSAFGDGRGAAQREHYRRCPRAAGWRRAEPLRRRLAAVGRARPDGARVRPGPCAMPATPTPQRAGARPSRRTHRGAGARRGAGRRRAAAICTSARAAARGDAARAAGRHVQPGARQGETRTHGFFYPPPPAATKACSACRCSAAAPAPASTPAGRARRRAVPAPARPALHRARRSCRPASGGARDDGCKASLRRLVRQRAADLPGRARVRAAGLRARRRPARERGWRLAESPRRASTSRSSSGGASASRPTPPWREGGTRRSTDAAPIDRLFN